MVWGMTLPEGFGEFWPSGSFEYDPVMKRSGWARRLNAYYFQQSPDVQTTLGEGRIMVGDYGFYAGAKFRNEVGTGEGNDPPFSAIEPHEAPLSFDTEKGHKSLGSLIKLNNMLLAVDESLMTIIERLEPGMHQFYPIEIRMPRGKTYPGTYYTLVVGQYFDAFSVDDSKPESINRHSSGSIYKPFPSNGLAVRKAVFGNAHLWRDRSFKAELTCFSDELKAEIDRAGLRLPKHYKMMEV